MNFSFKRMLATLWVRNKEFYRDRGTLGWIFIFPLLCILSFGYLFDLDEKGSFKVGFVGEKKQQIKMFNWIKYQNLNLAKESIRRQKLDLVVDYRSRPFRYWIAENSPNGKIAEKIWLASFGKKVGPQPIKKNINGRKVRYIDWLFPGLLTMNVLWMALWGVGWVIVRQRKFGILKRFKASPLTALEYLVAQMLSRLTVIVGSGIILFAGAHFIYPFETLGSYFDILIIYSLGCFSLSSIGLIVAARMTSEEFANNILNLLTYPMMFLSEIWFSLEGSSNLIKSFAYAMPLYHMTDAIRRIMADGATLFDLWPSILILLGTGIIFTATGAGLFKWNRD